MVYTNINIASFLASTKSRLYQVDDVIEVDGVPGGTASGTNTYTVTIDGIEVYAQGQVFAIQFTNANTTSSTLQVNSLSALTIKKSVTTNLASGDIPAGSCFLLIYDGANLQIIGMGGGGSGSGTVNSGNQYRLAYYATTGSAVSEAGAITATRALKSDANGVPTHFDTATEPSLTELSYVKGVTSAIQTQLNELGYWRTLPGTPTRSSNTVLTITDTSNANLYDLKFNRGTVLKWTDTTVKQAMVVSATYATNTVTITIIGDVLASSATMNTFKYALEKAEKVTFAIAGTIATGDDLSRKWKADKPYRVFGGDALHGQAGTTNATTYELLKNASANSLITTDISIASGATVGNGYTAIDGATLALDDVVSLSCNTVSTIAPVDVYVDMFIFPTYNQYL